MVEVQQKANAFFEGRQAYRDNLPETANRYTHSCELSKEWIRGYRTARKHARFNATIEARKAAKAKT